MIVEPGTTPPAPAARLHHVAVQTCDMANSIAWYRDFFGCQQTWTAQTFSELSRSRLPGVVRIAELAAGDLRFHLIERLSCAVQPGDRDEVQFQHFCVEVGSDVHLRAWRDRWIRLRASGGYVFLRPDPPTEIITDHEGTQSFYCFDVNGLEFEFTHIPQSTR